MSLNWNVANVKKPDLWVKAVDTGMGGLRPPAPEDKPEAVGEYLNPVTEAFIWLTMPVGIGKLTEATWKEFYLRLRMLDAVRGDSFSAGPVTPEMVREHIGLVTNASSKTRAAFLKDLGLYAEDEYRIANL